MGINKVTLETISKNSFKFSSELKESIDKLISFALEYSPMSDISYIYEKSDYRFPGFVFALSGGSWIPVRNIIRIIAKVSEQDANKGEIIKIEISQMFCGCDYFEGQMSYTIKDIGIKVGKYRWQWTAFPGRDLNYDKFNQFPEELRKIEKVSN